MLIKFSNYMYITPDNVGTTFKHCQKQTLALLDRQSLHHKFLVLRKPHEYRLLLNLCMLSVGTVRQLEACL